MLKIKINYLCIYRQVFLPFCYSFLKKIYSLCMFFLKCKEKIKKVKEKKYFLLGIFYFFFDLFQRQKELVKWFVV
jgi:hypothetical protein